MKKSKYLIIISLLFLISFSFVCTKILKNNTANEENEIEYKYFIDGIESIIKPENIGLFSFDSYECTNDLNGNWDNNSWSFIPSKKENAICFLNFKKLTDLVNYVKPSGVIEEEKQIENNIIEEVELKEEENVEKKKEEKKETENKKVIKKKKVIEEKPDDEEYMDLEEEDVFPEYNAYLKEDISLEYVEDKSIKKNIKKYEVVKVLNKNERFALVKYEVGKKEYRGIIRVGKIYKLPKKYIEVDISKQKLTIVENNEIVFKTDVVTGKPSTPTPKGYYKINAKKKKIYLKGPTWNSYVEYFMSFIRREYGLHDASWQSKYGGKVYLKNGSHGCVNIPLDKIKEIYKKVKVGTRILIHE